MYVWLFDFISIEAKLSKIEFSMDFDLIKLSLFHGEIA